MEAEPSTLYIVATPVGNLEDITYRAAKLLCSVDLVLAEDTRHSRVLLGHIGSKVHCESYNDFNKENRTGEFLSQLESGKSLAMISDAGTPGIADPAYYLVRRARERGIKVSALPGACALTVALSASGLPSDRFMFCNFPPVKSGQRKNYLEQLKEQFSPDHKYNPTLGFYVSPHKLISFVEDLVEVFGGDLKVMLARELTKKFEEYLDLTADKVLEYYSERKPKGEYVVLFNPQVRGIGDVDP